MTLNCLTCGQILQRVNSDHRDEYLPERNACRKVPMQVERSWSGNISPPQHGAVAKIKKERRRTNSAGNVGPRLVRSSGMRRDWSFEDLSGQPQDKRLRCH